MAGLRLVSLAREIRPELPLIVMTAHEDRLVAQSARPCLRSAVASCRVNDGV